MMLLAESNRQLAAIRTRLGELARNTGEGHHVSDWEHSRAIILTHLRFVAGCCKPIWTDGAVEMPFPRQYVDALLINWGDRLFHEPLRHVRARICPAWHCARCAASARTTGFDASTRARVMVKITNRASGAQGMGAVRRHLQYISRAGHVELENGTSTCWSETLPCRTF